MHCEKSARFWSYSVSMRENVDQNRLPFSPETIFFSFEDAHQDILTATHPFPNPLLLIFNNSHNSSKKVIKQYQFHFRTYLTLLLLSKHRISSVVLAPLQHNFISFLEKRLAHLKKTSHQGFLIPLLPFIATFSPFLLINFQLFF